ncbi:MAG: tyrosine-type recombinase/integrase [Pseudonocardiales bacterium]|nr:tyrosine-type recombinase/integrase [Pseudonocardiales bacterium]
MAGLPLSQAITEYLQWLELDRHASAGTVREYRADLKRFSEFVGGDAGIPDIAELDWELLRGYQQHLARLRTGPKGARRPLAISTRSRRLVALRSFLRFAAREQWLPGDLGATIDVPKLPERLPKPLEATDRDQLLEALPHDTLAQKRDRALILLLLSTGARISEILRLDRNDWKPDRLWVLGKGDRERVVGVTDKARAAVEDYLDARGDHSPALFIGFQPASKATSSNRLTTAGAQHICRHLARQLGIPAFHPHQLRHTLGTLLQESMGDARLTAEILGHRGLGSVSGYTKITDQRRREAYEEMQRRGL